MPTEYTTETGVVMAAKAGLPVGVTGATLLGIPVPEIIQWLTLVYIVVLLSQKGWPAIKKAIELTIKLKAMWAARKGTDATP